MEKYFFQEIVGVGVEGFDDVVPGLFDFDTFINKFGVSHGRRERKVDKWMLGKVIKGS